jgi:hypothetical protein
MRTTVRTALVVAQIAALAATALPAQATEAPASARATVTLQVESRAVAVGHRAELSGRAAAGRGATVTIWQMQVSTGRWGVEGTTRTRAGGAFRYSEVVHRGDRVYKACVRSSGRDVCSTGKRVNVVQEVRYSISAKAGAASYTVGQPVVVKGTVKPGARGDRLTLMRSRGGSDKAGVKVGAGRVGKKGRFRLHAPAEAGLWDYYVVKSKTAVGRSAMSGFVEVEVTKAAVGLAVSGVAPTTLTAGQPVTVTGSSTNLVGRTVYLQAYDAASSSFGSIGSAVVDANGGWTVTAALNQAGKAVQLQVVAPETDATAAGSVAAGSVAVFGWYYLAELPMVDSVRFETGSAPVAGVTYSRSAFNSVDFWWNNTPWGEWNLAYSCRTFESSIGLDDASESGFQVGFRSFADSVERYHGVKTTGQQPTPISFDVTSVFRLKLQDEYVAGSKGSGGGHGWGVWADARVLCAF